MIPHIIQLTFKYPKLDDKVDNYQQEGYHEPI